MPIKDLDELLKRQQEYLDSIEPFDVPVLIGDRLMTARLPYLRTATDREVIDNYGYPNPVYRDPSGSWFRVPDFAREYPNVVLVDGDNEDELYAPRGREMIYRWPEIYDALLDEDKTAIQAAVWGMYVGEPKQHRQKAVTGRE